MSKAKILIVDDSAVMRRLLADAVNSDPALGVCDTANDGRQAIAAIERQLPDVILLDLEMPVLDGLGALRVITDRWSRLPVVVFSSFTAEGSAASIQALTLGASECMLKPRSSSAEQAVADIGARLLPVVNALLRRASRRGQPRPAKAVSLARRSSLEFEALVIASSTGGPVALEQVLGAMGPVEVPVFIVQHMPPMFTAQLSRRLAEQTGLDIAEAIEGEQITPGMIRVAPGGLHLEVHRSATKVVTHLTAAAPVHHVRPAADPLFATATAAFRGRVLGLVLTGMGVDGADGAKAIVDAGGEVIVQDEATSVVWGMPGAVAEAGLASELLPLDRLGPTVRRRLAGNVARRF